MLLRTARTERCAGELLTPVGRQVELPKPRPQAIVLRPDGRLLAVSGKTDELILIDPATGATRQRVTLPATPSLRQQLMADGTQGTH